VSILNLVLYGNRLYDQETYSINEDAQTFSVTLSDSVSLSDLDRAEAIKALSDSLLLTDSILRASTKRLSDSLTLSDSHSFIATEVLSDSISVTDSPTTVQTIKGLSEFILIQDWIEFKWQRAEVWTITQAAPISTEPILSLYAQCLYGQDLYSGPPRTTWEVPPPTSEAWTNADGESHQ
jgi:hypothetical protein